jgi:hypothetical protein
MSLPDFIRPLAAVRAGATMVGPTSRRGSGPLLERRGRASPGAPV